MKKWGWILLIPTLSHATTLTGTLAGSATSQTFTVVSSSSGAGVFKLVFEAGDNWGLSQWYDLVNDTAATNNLAGPFYSVNGPSNPCFAEPGLANITYYGNSDDKQDMQLAGCTYPSSPRTFSILQNTSDMVVVESSANPMSATTSPDPNISGVVRYYIKPDGKIYIRKKIITGKNAVDLGAGGTQDLFIGTMGLEDPGKDGAVPPDTTGYIRATTEQNPFSFENHGDSATFAYWSHNTPAPYTNWSRASILEAWSPNNVGSGVYSQIIHSWNAGPGYGSLRWGYRISPGPNVPANTTLTYEFLEQLGAENTNVLPNIVTSSTATTIANAFISAPTFPTISTSSPTIQPNLPIIPVNSVTQITVDQGATCTLQAGSTGTITSDCVYTAPGNLLAKHVLWGWPIDSQDSVFTTDISSMPVDTSSTTYLHAQISAAAIQPQLDFPSQLHNNFTPTQGLVFANSGVAGNYELLAFPNLRVENGYFTDSRQVDQHILAVNRDNGLQTEIYKTFPKGFEGSSPCGGLCNSGSGVTYTNNYVPSQGVGAGGLPIQRLTDSYAEIKNCADNGVPIRHAMRFTLSNGPISNGFKWPAVAVAPNGGALDYGTWVRLKGTFTPTGTAAQKCIQVQAQHYGMLLDDIGTTFGVQFQQDAAGDYGIASDILGLSSITGFNSDNFEVINSSTMKITDGLDPSSGSWRVNPSGPYVTPDSWAVVIASNTTTHLYSKMPISILPVAIGVENYMGYTFLAGTPATQLNVWVDSATIQTFSCTMTPTLGTLTSGGLYTPPSTVVNFSSSVVTCTADADATAKVVFPIFVHPLDGIRVRLSNATNVDYGPDVNSKMWRTEQGAYWRLQGHANCDWTSQTWTGVTDSGLYKQCEYVSNGSGDLLFRFNVPNGTYRTSLYFAVGDAFSAGAWMTAIDSQGQIYSGSSATTMTGGGPWTFDGITGKQVDICDVTGSCATKSPGTVTLDQTVSDGTLYFAVRHLAPNGVSQPASLLNAFQVVLVSSGTTPSPSNTSTKLQGHLTISGQAVIR